MGQRQPVGHLVGGFFGGRPVEWHQRGSHAGRAPELRAPSVVNRRHFNPIESARDVVLEVVDVHVEEAQILRGRETGSSEARREARIHSVR